MFALERSVRNSGLDHRLIELIKMRCSQMNGCAYCIDMHSKDARAAGETEQRLYALDAWRETPFFSQKERAALAWAEAVMRVASSHAPDDVYEELRAEFSEDEAAKVTMAAVTINAWNRIALASRAMPGSYQATTAAV